MSNSLPLFTLCRYGYQGPSDRRAAHRLVNQGQREANMLIPIRVDVPMDRRPWINWVLMGTIILVSLIAFGDLDVYASWSGLTAGRSTLSGVNATTFRTAVTSSFLHAGGLHLIGNMLFLWIFGNAINYKFGHPAYMGLYLLSALVSGLMHYTLHGGPVVGASGAIYGVMGAFLIYFPRNEITVVWLVPTGLGRTSGGGYGSLSSGWMILAWVAWDVVHLCLGLTHSVALWGHVGGFLAGTTIGVLCAATGLVRPTQDEQTLLQLLGGGGGR